ncbi:hypothetical protein CYMTET_46694 [Cymbomonas tetramitiformis]|uniref:Uncharacterized protein n=1 Tax=Cymbomonas tetramitiformis TaxID=36881 RepID=A0AAE0BXG2_9CHLO|nr:hypothetical protein CYMTET_46694 [Cymbomonas tetramitiformis]
MLADLSSSDRGQGKQAELCCPAGPLHEVKGSSAKVDQTGSGASPGAAHPSPDRCNGSSDPRIALERAAGGGAPRNGGCWEGCRELQRGAPQPEPSRLSLEAASRRQHRAPKRVQDHRFTSPIHHCVRGADALWSSMLTWRSPLGGAPMKAVLCSYEGRAPGHTRTAEVCVCTSRQDALRSGPVRWVEVTVLKLVPKPSQKCGCASQVGNHESCEVETRSECGTCPGSSCDDGTCPFPGAYRDGYCHEEGGTHKVCAVVSHKLEKWFQSQGNDLSSVVSDGGGWCLCKHWTKGALCCLEDAHTYLTSSSFDWRASDLADDEVGQIKSYIQNPSNANFCKMCGDGLVAGCDIDARLQAAGCSGVDSAASGSTASAGSAAIRIIAGGVCGGVAMVGLAFFRKRFLQKADTPLASSNTFLL